MPIGAFRLNSLSAAVSAAVNSITATGGDTITYATISGTKYKIHTFGSGANFTVSATTGSQYIPSGTIIQSVDSSTNSFITSPACWIPSGTTISSTAVAYMSNLTISNGGSGYVSPPIINFIRSN